MKQASNFVIYYDEHHELSQGRQGKTVIEGLLRRPLSNIFIHKTVVADYWIVEQAYTILIHYARAYSFNLPKI